MSSVIRNRRDRFPDLSAVGMRLVNEFPGFVQIYLSMRAVAESPDSWMRNPRTAQPNRDVAPAIGSIATVLTPNTYPNNLANLQALNESVKRRAQSEPLLSAQKLDRLGGFLQKPNHGQVDNRCDV